MAKSKIIQPFAKESRMEYQSNPFSPFRKPEPKVKVVCAEAEATITVTKRRQKRLHNHPYLFKVVGLDGDVIRNGEAKAFGVVELVKYLSKHFPMSQFISVRPLN